MINYQQFIINDCFTAVIAHSGPVPDFSCNHYTRFLELHYFKKKSRISATKTNIWVSKSRSAAGRGNL